MSTAAQTDATEKQKKGSGVMAVMQRIGRSLMLPVAVMPAAALLVRLGNTDMLGRESFPTVVAKIAGYMSAGGGAIINNIALLFCVGIAIGFAKKADGSTGLAAVAGYLVYQKVLATFPTAPCEGRGGRGRQDGVDGDVPGPRRARRRRDGHAEWPCSGSASTGPSWSDWLGFFDGRRLVPILSSFAGLVIGVVFGLIWPVRSATALDHFGKWLVGPGAVGRGIFGVANRALLPVGMHQFLNSFPWFQAGDFTKPDGAVHGDIPRFLAGDPTRRAVHDRLLPDHDVRPARACPGHRALRAPRAPQGRRRHDDVARR